MNILKRIQRLPRNEMYNNYAYHNHLAIKTMKFAGVCDNKVHLA